MHHVFVLPLFQQPHLVCSRPWTHRIFCKRGKPKQGINKEKNAPTWRKRSLYGFLSGRVVIGGDFNVDFSWNSANTRSLQDFISDFSLFISIDLPYADVPYTFIKYDSCTSKIDHFLLSQSMKSNVLLCAIIDNHLYSDHIPLQFTLSLDISHDKQIELSFEVRQSWCKATGHDIRKYKDNLDEQLDNIVLCYNVVYCKDHTCTQHRYNLYKIYSSVIDSCVSSSQHIPNNSSYKSSKVMPGWNDQV